MPLPSPTPAPAPKPASTPAPDLNALLAQSVAKSQGVIDMITAWLDAQQIDRKKLEAYPADSGGVANDLMVYNRPALLKTVCVYNAGQSMLYLQVHDKICPATDGERPKLILAVPTGTTGSFDFAAGLRCGNGVYLCASSTDTVKTITTTPVMAFQATFQYDS